ncbi:tetratricopeptide repeat protein [Xanthomonas sp. SHU 199]|uniref:tetratricopeptide repeat protein n=1 Tax=Xanthomonas sp. SHU 199 TaxID=1591174 RepID=UPI0009DB4C59|nr:SEL1-like repeat protein [Xanthomonas sp. SHU 199]
MFNVVVQGLKEMGLFRMDKDSEQSLLADAKYLIGLGECTGAYEKLAELVVKENPEALFLCSTFSSSADEGDNDFEVRSLKFLARSAELGFAPAMYALAVCYATGDLVGQSDSQAEYWYKAAAESGSDSAKFHYAIALLDGVGVAKDTAAGLRLMQELLDSGNVEAEGIFPEISDRFPGLLIRRSLSGAAPRKIH